MPDPTVNLARYRWAELDEPGRRAALARPEAAHRDSLAADVAAIIAAVRRDGDAALRHFAQRFDGVTLEALRVSQDEFDAAEAALSEIQRNALRTAIDNVRAFHAAQLAGPISVETMPGVVCRRITRPIRAVGLYVPAGSAPLPSTVIMLAVPAALAGCPQRILCTPPQKDGHADPAVLTAARYCGVEEVYLVGGAQAVAAMAYGTETIPAVDKIYGPGNAFVTEAKLQVSRDPDGAALDLPAGPSEVLVIADGRADPEFVAADLLSQAEHGADSQVVLVTPSPELADAVEAAVAAQLTVLPRNDVARAALEHARVVFTRDLAEAFAVSNLYGPEHLIVQVPDAEAWLEHVETAGSVFLGDWTPESLGDYCSGTNHVLPTYGYARAWSGLSMADFQLHISVQEATPDGFRLIGPITRTLAELERLDAHALAVKLRLEALGQPQAPLPTRKVDA
ncbi:histidinol dehydrogenase [Thioalkalivibrio sp. XN279]|uniref:histidinol dehydrogenase n=1 Tax=Thioalkalivibrio sp. XN279 TaxID=2714953 RepID=UPI001F0F9032|nr:histidinol dehydrogenase [Thioalkalivibrio sp. XN279]